MMFDAASSVCDRNKHLFLFWWKHLGNTTQITQTQRLNPGINDYAAAAAFSSDGTSAFVYFTETDSHAEVLSISVERLTF